jgi:hypothetical protein
MRWVKAAKTFNGLYDANKEPIVYCAMASRLEELRSTKRNGLVNRLQIQNEMILLL